MQAKTDPIDLAYEKFIVLRAHIAELAPTVRSESDTRLKIIDRILKEVLGWEDCDINTEEPAGDGFIDYRLQIDGIGRVLVEAKKMSRDFELNDRKFGHPYKLSGAVFKGEGIEAIKQAVQYCAFRSIELACATNGAEWIIFRSNRLGDGLNVLEGMGFVFPSLDAIGEKFRLFYDLLSPEAVKLLRYRAHFQEAEGRIIRHSDFSRTVRSKESISFIEQPEIVQSLDRIMTSFFQRLTDEKNKDMLEHCFVETSESKAAEQKLIRLAEELVGHVRALDSGSGKQLADLIRDASGGSQNHFVLVIGTKGSGKSTFINRFFRLRLPAELKDSCTPITVNLAEANGDESGIIDWLRERLLKETENALQGRLPTWNEIIGHMFFSEYKRWSTGTMKYLYESDKESFKIEFGRHIEQIRKEKPDEYIAGLLMNLVHSRRKTPCIIFDNADHFSIDFQERVFQYARSLFEGRLCIVIMPITDKTSWQLSRQGALQSFENEALLLPSPSPRQIVEKRIDFVLKKLRDETINEKERSEYFYGKGIRVEFSDLTKFILTLQDVFLSSKKTARWLGALSNHDVRRLLELSRDVVNSPHLGFDDAFTSYLTGSTIQISEVKILKSIILCRYDCFQDSSSKFVHNLYELNSEISTSPLLGVRILQAMLDMQVNEGETKTTYVCKNNIIQYLVNMGFDYRVVELWLDAMLKRGLILNYDPTCVDIHSATKFEVSPCGEIHLFWATGNHEYISAMAAVTAIFDRGEFETLTSAYRDLQCHTHHSFWRWIAAFGKYLIREDRMFCDVPDHISYAGQKNLTRTLDDLGRRTAKPAFGRIAKPNRK